MSLATTRGKEEGIRISNSLYTQWNRTFFLIKSTEIILYLPFSDWFGTKRNLFCFQIILCVGKKYSCEKYVKQKNLNQNMSDWFGTKLNIACFQIILCVGKIYICEKKCWKKKTLIRIWRDRILSEYYPRVSFNMQTCSSILGPVIIEIFALYY